MKPPSVALRTLPVDGPRHPLLVSGVRSTPRLLAAVGLLSFLTTPTLLAAPRDDGTEPLRLAPLADATVRQAEPDVASGVAPELLVSAEPGDLQLAYLRFLVPPLAEGSFALRLYATEAVGGVGVLLARDDGWTEGDLTWERQALLDLEPVATVGSVPASAWTELDVSAAVQGPGTYVLVLAPAPGASLAFSSRQGTQSPELVLVKPKRRPTAAFVTQPSAIRVPDSVLFADRSLGDVVSWHWRFGDGTSSTQKNPVHAYTVPGTYTVTLTVADAAGTSNTTARPFCALRATNPGVWTTSAELVHRPTEGTAWEALLEEANDPVGTPNLSDQDDKADTFVLARALVFARTGEPTYRSQVIDACMQAIGTEADGDTLALGRNLVAYVVAADLVLLPAEDDCTFREWLRAVRTEDLQGRTLISAHEDRPNNWGTHAGASRVAVAVYLEDEAELRRCARVFRGWLGDRDAYAGFSYGGLSWQVDPMNPVGINPPGAVRDGHSLDGVLPDDQRRAGPYTWPPPKANYVWEALQGALAQAVILNRAGYPSWQWEQQALLRAVRWLHDVDAFPAEGDDTWLPHLVNHFYGTSFPAPIPSKPGKNLGFTDWSHGDKLADREKLPD